RRPSDLSELPEPFTERQQGLLGGRREGGQDTDTGRLPRPCVRGERPPEGAQPEGAEESPPLHRLFRRRGRRCLTSYLPLWRAGTPFVVQQLTTRSSRAGDASQILESSRLSARQ